MVFSIEGTGTLFRYIRGGDYDFEHCVENYKKYSILRLFNVGSNIASELASSRSKNAFQRKSDESKLNL